MFDLLASWVDEPPVHLMVRAYMGFKESRVRDFEGPSDAEAKIGMQTLARNFGQKKLKDAPARDRERFEQMKKKVAEAKKRA